MADIEFEATVFLSSILGFTARCERMTPPETVTWANGFLRDVTEAVLQHGGVPVKYMGDGFLAYFTGDDHTARALRAAIAARDTVAEPVVVGLATGTVCVASIGHPAYARPDILGAAVNRAFRVHASAAPKAASRIAVALDAAENLAGEFDTADAGEVTLKGVPASIRVQEILGLRG